MGADRSIRRRNNALGGRSEACDHRRRIQHQGLEVWPGGVNMAEKVIDQLIVHAPQDRMISVDRFPTVVNPLILKNVGQVGSTQDSCSWAGISKMAGLASRESVLKRHRLYLCDSR